MKFLGKADETSFYQVNFFYLFYGPTLFLYLQIPEMQMYLLTYFKVFDSLEKIILPRRHILFFHPQVVENFGNCCLLPQIKAQIENVWRTIIFIFLLFQKA